MEERKPNLGIINRHPKKFATAAAALLALGGLELAGYLTNQTEPIPKGTCTSAFATTATFVDHGGDQWRTDMGIGKGIVLHVNVPATAEGVAAGFESPNASHWTASEMVPATGNVALKLGIGTGDVVFGAQVVSHNESDCEKPPVITVTEYSASGYVFDASGRDPWPNPVNTVVNLLP